MAEEAKQKYTINGDIDSCYRGAATMVFALPNDMGRGPAVTRQTWNMRDAGKDNMDNFKAILGPHQVKLQNLNPVHAIILAVRGGVIDFNTLTRSWDPMDLKPIQWLEGAIEKTGAVVIVNGNHRSHLTEELCQLLISALNTAKAEVAKCKAKGEDYAKHEQEIHELEAQIAQRGLWAVKIYDLGTLPIFF